VNDPNTYANGNKPLRKERKKKAPPPAPEEAADPLDPAAEAEAEMMKMMGFGGFNSTQGQHVEDPFSNASAIYKKTTRRARQYMNRPGGFNRPLPDELTGVRSNKI